MQASNKTRCLLSPDALRALIVGGLLAIVLAGSAAAQVSQEVAEQRASSLQRGNGPSPAMQYFGGRLTNYPTRQPARPQLPPPRPRPGRKPFEGLKRKSTISPYLSLDILQTDTSLPNYYAYVRPQQQQQLANKTQQREIRRLQQQLHESTAAGIVANNPRGGIPTTGHSAQFLNMGGYFPDPR